VATRGGEGATQSHSLSTCHPDDAPVLLEEDAATVTKLLTVRLITKGLKKIFCLFVGYEEDQAQELAVDAARGRHARRQKATCWLRRYVLRSARRLPSLVSTRL
jgi:hypothetical protein